MAGEGARRMSIPYLRESPEFAALRAAAVRFGNDPLQIQGPGGNVSLKAGGQMLVKASGTWLADAAREDIFAPVDAEAMKKALVAGAPTADRPAEFLLSDALRPSIETSFHAALDAPVVLHTHCVATLARSTASIPATDLDALRLVFVPYHKPGAALARSVLAAWHPGVKGVVLGNHGLIATGETVAEAEAFVRRVARHFDRGPAPQADADPAFAAALEGSGWQALDSGATTALAFDPQAQTLAEGAPLFPDQVIFLGPELIVSDLPVKTSAGPPVSLALVPGHGAAVPEGASPAVVALARMIGEVVYRLPQAPTRLNRNEALDLLGWDAETYRQALEQARTARLSGAER